MRTILSLAVALLVCLPMASPVRSQDAQLEAELAAYWEEVERTVAEGDHEAMVKTYHPDAVSMSLNNELRINIVDMGEGNPERDELIRSGQMVRGIKFELLFGTASENAAYQHVKFHFWRRLPGEEMTHAYGVTKAFLVKKGHWAVIAEDLDWTLSKEEWDALEAG